MKNLNMWLKLGLGFGLVLLLTCILSATAYRNMSNTSDDSDHIALWYMPGVEYSSGLESSLRELVLQVRTYDITGDAAAYNSIQKLIAETHKYEELLVAHSKKYPHLPAIQKFATTFPNIFSDYINLIQFTKTQKEKMVANTQQRYELASVADKAIDKLSDAIRVELNAALQQNNTTPLPTLLEDLNNNENMRFELMNMRRILAQAELRGDQEMLKEALEQAKIIDENLVKLMRNATTASSRATIEGMEKGIKAYQQSVREMGEVWQSLGQAAATRTKAAETTMQLSKSISEAGIDITQKLANATSLGTTVEAQQMLYMAVGVLILGLLIAWWLTRSITRPLFLGVSFAQAVATGHLDETLSVHSKDEIGRLCDALRAMVESLKGKIAEANEKSEQARLKGQEAMEAMETARQAQAAAETAKRDGMLAAAEQLEGVVAIVSSASTELSAQIEQSERGSAEQASRVTETATAMEEMNSTVIEVAKNAGLASEVSARTRDKAEDGARVVQQAVDSIQSVQQASVALKSDMAALSEQAQSISQIMGVISDIADQTNLLALNAAIEAARAGEAGRGFAVVADEVRKLAEKTMASTTDVGNAIRSIQQSAEKSVIQVDATVQNIEQATTLATQSGNALHEIVSMVDNTADQVRAIATASEQQSATSEEINRSISQVNNIANETARSMQEAASAVSDLANQAQVLSGLINDMKRG